ncbi:MAG: hypothetical protein LBF97_07305 [Elusimicrobiota bacterium]|jgi:hypothetical protein|nr:hypothetical protein [Elusimicrobiota bacterium]
MIEVGYENMKKVFKIFFITILIFTSINIFIFAYETTKTTQISANPSKYNNKQVLVYIKFDRLTYEDTSKGVGYFEELNIKGIEYQYKLSDTELVKNLKTIKNRDMITVKGKVVVNGFSPIIQLDSFEKGWVDTTLLPPTPDTITITCPHCGYVFKYKITDQDYKNAIIDKRSGDNVTPVVSSNVARTTPSQTRETRTSKIATTTQKLLPSTTTKTEENTILLQSSQNATSKSNNEWSF